MERELDGLISILVNIAFSQSDNSKANISKLTVLDRISSLLGDSRMPICTVAFDHKISGRKIEIHSIPFESVLRNIRLSKLIENGLNRNLQRTDSGFRERTSATPRTRPESTNERWFNHSLSTTNLTDHLHFWLVERMVAAYDLNVSRVHALFRAPLALCCHRGNYFKRAATSLAQTSGLRLPVDVPRSTVGFMECIQSALRTAKPIGVARPLGNERFSTVLTSKFRGILGAHSMSFHRVPRPRQLQLREVISLPQLYPTTALGEV